MIKTLNAAEIIALIEGPYEYGKKKQIRQQASNREIIRALEIAQSTLTRQVICDILGEKKAKSAFLPLIACLDDPSSGIRSSAAESLAKLGNPKAGPALLQRTERETETGIRNMFIVALGAVKYHPAIPLLIAALNDSDGSTRGSAAWSLGELKSREATQALFNAVTNEKYPYARERMKAALVNIAADRRP